jgi:hypothetical protein
MAAAITVWGPLLPPRQVSNNNAAASSSSTGARSTTTGATRAGERQIRRPRRRHRRGQPSWWRPQDENNGEQYQRHDGRERHNNPIAAGARGVPARKSSQVCPWPKGARHYGRCPRHPRPLAMQGLSGPAAPGAAKRLCRGLAATASGRSSTPGSATTLSWSTNLGFALLGDARAQLLFRLSSAPTSRMRQARAIRRNADQAS